MRRRVARLADLPQGCGWLVEVDGREIALFRRGDRVHALDNACPHRGASLAHGDVRAGMVYCPLHAWGFDLASGACPEFPEASVETIRVRIEGEYVEVEL